MRSNRVQLVHDVSVGRLEDAIDHVDDEVLEAVEELVVREERALGLDVRVPAREPNRLRNVCGRRVLAQRLHVRRTVNTRHSTNRAESREQQFAIFLIITVVAHRKSRALLDALGEVAPSARLLGAVGARDAEAVAHRRDGRLEVELRALRQVRLLVEVLQLEQCAPALHLRLHQRRRHHLRAQHAVTYALTC